MNTERSEQLFEEARRYLPGGADSPARQSSGFVRRLLLRRPVGAQADASRTSMCRTGRPKLLTRFHPASGQVGGKGVTSSANAVLPG